MGIRSKRNFEDNDENLFYDMARLFYDSNVTNNNINDKFLQTTFNNCMNNNPYVRGLFVCIDNEVCGYALLTFSYSNEYGGKIMEIDEIFIIDKYRNNGLANYFLSSILSEYENSVVYIEVAVKKDNQAAINLCKKFGFSFNEYLIMYKTQHINMLY